MSKKFSKGKKEDRLTDREQRFVDQYLSDADMNATQAALNAGYSERSCRSIAHELMTRPRVLKAIQQGIDARAKRTQIDQDYVLRRANDLLLCSLGEKPIIKTINVDGALVEQEVREFNANGVGKALELLGKHVDVQAFKERMEHSVPEGVVFNMSFGTDGEGD